ncbi:hypothetical protein Hanom_Chr00s000002g01599231 [Helianthus anomalus]
MMFRDKVAFDSDLVNRFRAVNGSVRVTASVHMFGSSSARSTIRSRSSGYGSEFVEQYGSCQTQSNRVNLGQTRLTQPVDSVKLWVNSVIPIDGTTRGFGK